jgi:hypothetical protein
MILLIENFKERTRKLLELVSSQSLQDKFSTKKKISFVSIHCYG